MGNSETVKTEYVKLFKLSKFHANTLVTTDIRVKITAEIRRIPLPQRVQNTCVHGFIKINRSVCSFEKNYHRCRIGVCLQTYSIEVRKNCRILCKNCM